MSRGPRYCDHEFHTVMLSRNTEDYAIIICAYCGQPRHLYTDGRVHITKEEGEVKKTYGIPSNTNTIA